MVLYSKRRFLSGAVRFLVLPAGRQKGELAYEIQKVNEGFYSFTTFEAPASAPAEIEARMRIMENVLRYLIIRKDA